MSGRGRRWPYGERRVAEQRVFAAFDEVFAEEEPIPSHLIEVAKELYVWRDVDVEILDLLLDSAHDDLALVRAESLQRFMAFGNDERGIQFDCQETADGFSIEGTVTPAGGHTVRVQRAGHSDLEMRTDSFGWFRIEQVQPGSVSATIELSGGGSVRTPWFRLE